MGTDSFVIYVKTEDVYEDIADNVKKWFDISNNSTDDKRPLTKGEGENKLIFSRINQVERL